MGWAGGSLVAQSFINSPHVSILDDKLRKGVYIALFEALSGNDWDTVDECRELDPVFDEVIEEYW